MPGLQPRQLGVGGARAGLGHLGEPKIDTISQNRRHQQGFVLGHVAGLQVCEVAREARPFIDLHQQLGDLEVRQQHRRLVNQGLRGVWNRCVQRRDLQARCSGDDGIR